MRSLTYPLLVSLLSLLAVACPRPVKAPAGELPVSTEVQARYIVLGAAPGGETVAHARAIVGPQGACPGIQAAQAAQPIAMGARDNPHGFPVKVCEALVPLDTDLTLVTTDGTLSLPRVKSQIERVLVMGDTGCKSKDCAPGTPAQPFAKLAAGAAAGESPDVILHMGDYNYRGTGSHIELTVDGKTAKVYSYDAGDGVDESQNCLQTPDSGFLSQNAANAQPHDNWPDWRDDFFVPAGELLHAAPWVLARGNHELCSRAGPGWFYFLDPSSNLHGAGGQTRCPEPEETGNPIASVVLNQPYRVSLGGLNVIVVDSANACDAFVTPPMRDFTDAYIEQFKKLPALTPAPGPTAGTTWMMSHRPLWGVSAYQAQQSTGCTAENQLGCINQVMQNALTEGLGGTLPAGVTLSLSGHMHHFQSLTFAGGVRPPQLVVGNGGVALSADGPTGTFATPVQGSDAQVLSIGTGVTAAKGAVSGYGFLNVQLGAEGNWTGQLVNTAEAVTLAVCGSQSAREQGAVCRLAVDIRLATEAARRDWKKVQENASLRSSRPPTP